MSKEKLIPYEKYRLLNHEVPYIFHLKNDHQHLFYFGAKHTFDSQDPQYKKILALWNTFLKVTGKKNCLTLIEGGVRLDFDNEKVAIRDGGEMSYVSYLARINNIETISPEPPASYRYGELLKKFTKKEIAYYDFALACYQRLRYDSKPTFEEYIKRFLKSDKRKSGWKDFDFSLENMATIHKEIFGTDFDENNIDFFQKILDPYGDSVISKISLLEEAELRDTYIVEEIERFWSKGKNLFVIYGSSHAVRQEPVIRSFVSR